MNIRKITVALLCFFTLSVTSAHAYDLGTTFTVGHLKTDSSKVFDLMEDTIDYLEGNINYVPRYSKIFNTPTRNDSANYLHRLASHAVKSYLALSDDPGLSTVSKTVAEQYFKYSLQLQDVLTRLLAWPTKSLGREEISAMQRDNDLPAEFYSEVDLSGAGSDYHFSMIAYRLLHQNDLYRDMSTLFSDLENDIDTMPGLSYDERRSLYGVLADITESMLHYELLRTPKSRVNGLSSEVETIVDNAIERSREMMYQTLWGGPVSAQSLGADWFKQAGKLSDLLKMTTQARVLTGISYGWNSYSTIDYTFKLRNYLDDISSSLGQIIDMSEFELEQSRCESRYYATPYCMGSEEKDEAWVEYDNPDQLRDKDNRIISFYVPYEARQRLRDIQKRFDSLDAKANSSGTPPKVHFVQSLSLVNEGDGQARIAVQLELASGNLGWPISVEVVPGTLGSASRGVDYSSETVSVTFPSGSTSGAIQYANISITADSQSETDENFFLYLNSLTGGALYDSPNLTEVTISNTAPSTTWKERETNQHLYGASYGNGLFVSVGGAGTIMISTDGIQWEVTPTPTTKTLNDVIYGNGRYVAVGESGNTLYSDDGKSWQLSQVEVTGINSVVYGNGVFVAVGDGGRVWTSSNGVAWTLQSTNVTNDLYSVGFGDGQFIVGGAGGTLLASNNGSDWILRTSPTTGTYYDVLSAGGQFLAASSSNYVYRSSDGVTWSPAITNLSGDVRGLSYDGNQYLAVTVYGDVYTSLDGISWTKRQDLSNSYSCAYGNGRFVVVGYGGSVTTSIDGVDWTPRTSSIGSDYFDLIYAGGQYLAGSSDNYVYRSSDGVTWSSAATNLSGDVRGLSYDGNQYLAVTVYGDVYTSLDSISWTKRQDLSNSYSCAYGNGRFVVVGYGGSVANSSDGVNWSIANLPSSANLYGVTYGGNGFTAVGTGGTIYTSTDGVSWSPQVSGTTVTLNDVAYGLGVYLAVGESGNIGISTNGVNWSFAAHGTLGLNTVSIGETRLYAAGDAGSILVSDDGQNWSSQTVGIRDIYAMQAMGDAILAVGESSLQVTVGPITSGNDPFQPVSTLSWKERETNQYLYGATYGNGLFVSVGAAGTIMISTDGIQWEVSPTPTTKTLNDVVYGNGRYVAVGESGNTLYSDDGKSWQLSQIDVTGLNGVVYGNGVFVAVGDGGRAWTSSNGVAWTLQNTNVTDDLYSVGFGDGQFIIGGAGGTLLASNSGTNWVLRTSTATGTYYDVLSAGGQFLAANSDNYVYRSSDGITWSRAITNLSGDVRGLSYDGNQYLAVTIYGAVYTSPDGISWTKRQDFSNSYSCAYGNGRFVVVGYGGSVTTSIDGVNWTSRTSSEGGDYQEIIYAGGQYLAGNSDNYVYRSSDGVTWSASVTNLSGDVRGLAYGGNQYLAVTVYGKVFTSLDGISWTLRQDLDNSYSCAYGNGRFVVVGIGGAVATSSDGVNWTVANLPSSTTLYDVTYGGNGFTAVGTGGAIYTSTDGLSWSPQVSGTTATLNDVAYGLGVYVAVGESGNIGVSTDGIQWNFAAWTGTAGINTVSFGTKGFVALGDSGWWWHSTDLGITWSVGQTISERNYYGSVQNNGIVYSVGAAGLLADTGAEIGSSGEVGYPQVLVPGQTVSDLWDHKGDRQYFVLDVPANTTDLLFAMYGGYGDPDMFVRYGSPPDENTYDCRPYDGDSNENCIYDNPQSGLWYVMIQGNNFYTGVSLTAQIKQEIKHKLSVSRTGSGTIYSSNRGGISCGNDCSQSYLEGTSVTLDTNAATGWQFTGWGGSYCSGSGLCSVSMSAARSVSANFTRLPANDPPVWNGLTDRVVTPGQTLTVSLSATDPENDSLTYSVLTSGPRVSGNTLTWTPTTGSVGHHSIKLTVTDNVNSPVTKFLQVYVEPPANYAPEFQIVPNFYVKPGEHVSFEAQALDPNPNDTVNVSLTSALPEGASFAAGQFNWQPGYNHIGQHTISFRATDGSLTDVLHVVVTVALENRPPELLPISVPAVEVGSLIQFMVVAEDPDGDTVTISASGLPPGAVFLNNMFSWVPENGPASYPVVFSATDNQPGAGEVTTTVNISVLFNDMDKDSISDSQDNCPAVKNIAQADSDQDGIGDSCDNDGDNDNILDATDNCPLTANTNQADSDEDGLGDACDICPNYYGNLDADSDGVLDCLDNDDTDGDGFTDAQEAECDGDPLDPYSSCVKGLPWLMLLL